MSLPLREEHWRDLVGKPYADLVSAPDAEDGCFWLVVLVHRRMGYRLPNPAADAVETGWQRVEDPVPGDAVTFRQLRGRRWGEHTGILLQDGALLHASPKTGAVVQRSFPTASITGYWRPRETEALPAAGAEPGHPGLVTVRLVPSMASQDGRVTVLADPDYLSAYIPNDWADYPDQLAISVCGRSIPMDDWGDATVKAGEEVVIARVPGIPASIFSTGSAFLTAAGELTALGIISLSAINLAISIGLSFLSSLLLGPPAPARREDQDGSPTYNLDGIKNSIRPGGPIPVIYGEQWTGGQVIQLFFKVDSNGRSILYMLLALSQGEIDSIAGLGEVDDYDGALIPSDIKINGNPAANYRNVRISTRLGTTDQAIIPGFRGITTAVPYGITLDDGVPFIHTTTNRIDAFDVNFYFPQGLVNINDEGDAGIRTVTYTVRWRRLGTTTWTSSGNHTITRATTAAFSAVFNQAGLVRDRYEIETTRVSPAYPETQADKVSTSQLNTINEIVSDDLIYPNVALLAVKAMATDQLNGSVPTITSKVRGKKVWIWDGVSTTAPAFTKSWTQSAPWIAYDILTDKFYGAGRYIDASIPYLPDFAYAHTFGQTAVSDGRGGTHVRCAANITYDTTQAAWDAAQAAVNPFRMALAQVGNQVRLRVEEPKSYSQLFTWGNLIAGKLTFTYKNPKKLTNFIEAQYWNEELNGDPDVIQDEDQTSLDSGDPIRKITMTVQGATHPARVKRAAKFRLLTERAITKIVAFEAAADAVACEAGDVIALQHMVIKHGEGGRLWGKSSSSALAFDRPCSISANVNDWFVIRTHVSGVDVFQTGYLQAGTYGIGDAVPLVQSDRVTGLTLSEAPSAGNLYAFGPSTTYVKQWKVTSITLTQRLTRRIECVNYDASIYNDDPGTVPSATDTWPNPRTIPTAVSNVRAKPRYSRMEDGTIMPWVDVDWTTDRAEDCEVYVRRMDLG